VPRNANANFLRVYFWMLGQDVRLGVLEKGGFEKLQPGVYQLGSLRLFQLGLSLPDGLCYDRPSGRFVNGDFQQLWPHLAPYEQWVGETRPDYRKRLLRICPPHLRPLRHLWRKRFQDALYQRKLSTTMG